MKITQLQLQNFRCFENVSIDFNENLTVLVAPNGIGKTSILDAVRIMLWSYVKSFYHANDISNSLAKDDVSIISHKLYDTVALPSKITASIDWNRDKNITYTKFRDEKNILKEDTAARKVTAKAREYNKKISSREDDDTQLPVLGYYGTGRLWSFKKHYSKQQNIKKNIGMPLTDRRRGYVNCLDPASSYRVCEQWVTSLFEQYNDEFSFFLDQNADRDNSEIQFIPPYSLDCIKLIKRCLNQVLEHTCYRNLAYRMNKITNRRALMMYDANKKIHLPIDLLSDGVRSVISLVLDILYRCCKVNPQLGQKANNSTGIILIDEVDMHLHPKWQQIILGQLTEAFPHLQFIVTTHSPQVLSTVDPEKIRVIDFDINDNQYKIYVPNFSIGAESSVVLEDIFHVDSRAMHLQIVKDLRRYEELVDLDEWDSTEALRLREQLDIWGKNREAVLDKLDIRISVKQFQRDNAKS